MFTWYSRVTLRETSIWHRHRYSQVNGKMLENKDEKQTRWKWSLLGLPPGATRLRQHTRNHTHKHHHIPSFIRSIQSGKTWKESAWKRLNKYKWNLTRRVKKSRVSLNLDKRYVTRQLGFQHNALSVDISAHVCTSSVSVGLLHCDCLLGKYLTTSKHCNIIQVWHATGWGTAWHTHRHKHILIHKQSQREPAL